MTDEGERVAEGAEVDAIMRGDVPDGNPPSAVPREALPESAYYNRAGADELRARLASETLLAQGPTGTVLMSELGAADVPPAFWNLAEPQTVTRVHELYVAAGAEVLITNTFQASAPALERDQIDPSVAEVNRAAVDDARAARPQLLLGSIGPCGLEWFKRDTPEFRACRAAYREQALALLTAGVDGLLLETFTSIRDLEPALAGLLDVADGMPVLVSFAVDDEGNLLGDGLGIEGAVVYAEKHGAAAVGINCCSLAAAEVSVPRLVRAARTPVMARPHTGLPERTPEGDLVWPEDPEAFARAAATWRDAGVALVGACCGATPRTTAAQADALAEE